MLLFCCFLLLAVFIFAWYLSLCLYPDLPKASWLGVTELLKISSEEKDLVAVVKGIKSRNARSYFQTTLQEDIRLTHNSKKTVTFANKTSNMYRLTKEEHNKLLRNVITLKRKIQKSKTK